MHPHNQHIRLAVFPHQGYSLLCLLPLALSLFAFSGCTTADSHTICGAPVVAEDSAAHLSPCSNTHDSQGQFKIGCCSNAAHKFTHTHTHTPKPKPIPYHIIQYHPHHRHAPSAAAQMQLDHSTFQFLPRRRVGPAALAPPWPSSYHQLLPQHNSNPQHSRHHHHHPLPLTSAPAISCCPSQVRPVPQTRTVHQG